MEDVPWRCPTLTLPIGVQVVTVVLFPKGGTALFDSLVTKSSSFVAFGRKGQNSQNWRHRQTNGQYNGQVRLERGLGEVVTAVVVGDKPNNESELLKAFLGYVTYNFRDDVAAVSITY